MVNEPTTTTSLSEMSLAARIAWAALIVVTLVVCYFSNLGVIGFVGPDEPRYAWIARGMAESGDWVTPRLYGKPWFEKPVLYYWMAGASFRLFGVSEVAARLPSAICALLGTLALAWLAWRVYGAEIARWLLLLLPTSVGMIGFSHAAATDMPFSAMLIIAMVCAAVVMGFVQNENTPILPRTPWLALLLFGFFLGLAVLAKGPAAIILSGGGVFFWALFTKKWREAFRLLHPVAIASFCATALPWYILCARRNPDFFRIFIIEHNFKRYLTPEFQHIQPFWYYATVLLVALLPWSFIALGAAAGSFKDAVKSGLTEKTTFFLSWALFCVAFFSISKSKLPGYILPAFPPCVLLVSMGMYSMGRVHSRMSAVGAQLGGAIFGLLSLLPLLLPSRRNSFVVLPLVGLVVGAFCLSNLFVAGALGKKLSPAARAVLQLFVVIPILVLFAGVSPAIHNHWFWVKSPRSVASALLNYKVPTDQLRTFRLKRDTQYALNFYVHSEIKDWEDNPINDGYVISVGKYCQDLKTNLNCKDLWGRVDFGDADWSLLRITPSDSASGASHGGQLH
jgi:4-amino-4-deoxy-L-arabinose transferase-like glycosyltransferase